ncbi:NUDIX hydrolase [Chryseobacterium indologenes]|nr:hypothetical protein [Chryseobacterium indologenes]
MKTSAGIVLFKRENNEFHYFLVHPGGPFWKNKDLGKEKYYLMKIHYQEL